MPIDLTEQIAHKLATLVLMLRCRAVHGVVLGFVVVYSALFASGQTPAITARVAVTVVDENGLLLAGAQVILSEPGRPVVEIWTDYAGRCSYSLHQSEPYQIRIEKPGFYQTVVSGVDPHRPSVEVVLVHEQVVREQVNVEASAPGIDPQRTSDQTTMNTPEIVNVPYPSSRDIRNLLPFNPGVLQDSTGQVHLAGSQTYEALDLLDGFDIRSPVSGILAMRVSPDAIRSIDIETTRYPVEFGKATGGVVAFYAGMGDNKFRFNATNFIPSFHKINGLRFDKFVPRATFSGPLVRNRVWFFDGFETEYDNVYIRELPADANTNLLLRGSNLIKVQGNLTATNILSGGFLLNYYHSPYDGLTSQVPQESTTKRNTTSWLVYGRDQQSYAKGALLEMGAAVLHFHDGHEPRGNSSFEITPETTRGGYFENLTGHSQREQGTATLYLPLRHLPGQHDLKAGLELDHISFDQNISRSPISYLREDGTLLRRSTFPAMTAFARNNFETGAYVQDRWQIHRGLLVEPGLRFDWDEILRHPLFSPRIALSYAFPGEEAKTKLTAGIGLYHGHTQLEYLERALAGVRYDTYYAANGTTPIGGPLLTLFTENDASLKEMRAINWSIGVERKFPGSLYGAVNFVQKRESNGFTYANQSGPNALSGNYLLTSARQDHYDSVEFNVRRSFAKGYNLFLSYTRSSARTSAAIDYIPTLSLLGPQQSGPQAWDTPNRVISWGWLPFLLPKFKRSWDFVYTLDWHSGFPFSPVNANQQVVGAVNSQRFPDYFSLSPGLEWRVHFHGYYFGLRGVMENATNSTNPAIVNNIVDSPQYLTFSEPQGRTFTARIRLIGTKQR